MGLMQLGIAAVEAGVTPDALTRGAIRALCRKRKQELAAARPCLPFLESLQRGPIARSPEQANRQHYELPAEFFRRMLGPRRKYSCCYFRDPRATLAEAEDEALRITAHRAQLADGQAILELGCGWGALSLWMAERYPSAQITALSNSHAQRRAIEQQMLLRGLTNLRVVTSDMNHFEVERASFDRVVSVEMFEHMRNYNRLLERIARWLRPSGKLFVHLFCHRQACYPFESQGALNWMGRHFFTGGMMPSYDLLRNFDGHLRVCEQYAWSGKHYQRTADCWLERLDAQRVEVLEILRHTFGPAAARRWFNRWRMFFMAVSETFGFDDGREWHVGHYLLEPALGG